MGAPGLRVRASKFDRLLVLEFLACAVCRSEAELIPIELELHLREAVEIDR